MSACPVAGFFLPLLLLDFNRLGIVNATLDVERCQCFGLEGGRGGGGEEEYLELVTVL